MARKKEPDKLTLEMRQCEKDGFGVHYGRWKATQPSVKYKDDEVIPEGWEVCPWCGMAFKPKTKRKQIYCGAYCQQRASWKKADEKRKEKKNGTIESGS